MADMMSSKRFRLIRCILHFNNNEDMKDKLGMLTHLYKSPMRARRWYMRLFGYTLDSVSATPGSYTSGTVRHWERPLCP